MGSMSQQSHSDSVAERHLEHEIAEVEAAIAMVQTGAAASVTLTGLSHGEALVAAVREEAARSGVLVEPIWGWEEDHCDLVVRRIDDQGRGGTDTHGTTDV
jgi:hypothetical protein